MDRYRQLDEQLKRYHITSRLGKTHYYFDELYEASQFFNDFVGDVLFLEKGKIIDQKEDITDIPTLIHAGLFVQHGVKPGSDYIIDKSFIDPPSDQTLDNWHEAIEKFKIPGKGIMLFGVSGVGKTTLMRFLQMAAMGNYLDKRKSFDKVKVIDLIGSFRTMGAKVLDHYKLSDTAKTNICFDDLGRDKGGRLLYGDKVDIMGDIIDLRYDSFIEKGLITHFTTYFDDDELKKMYDGEGEPVIWGRICEMVSFHTVHGYNYRLK
jgi:hypothetical protein